MYEIKSTSPEPVPTGAKNPATPAAIGIVIACVIGILMLGSYGCWVRKKVLEREQGAGWSDRTWCWKDLFVNTEVQPDSEATGLISVAALRSETLV